MNANDLLAMALLFVAVTDTALAQTLLPKVLKSHPGLTPEQKKKILTLVNWVTLVFFAAAIVIYLTQPL